MDEQYPPDEQLLARYPTLTERLGAEGVRELLGLVREESGLTDERMTTFGEDAQVGL